MIAQTTRFLFASCLLLAACGGAPAAPATPEVSPSAGAVAPAGSSVPKPGLKANGEAAVGDRTSCPVSGEEFVVAADSPKTEYQGKTYYFCCPGCEKKFQADPQKFLSKK